MIDSRYKFGSDLRTVIALGGDKKTKLCELFENNLLQRTGISAIHSYFNQDPINPYIFISSDTDKNIDSFTPSEWQKIQDIYYPKEEVRNIIFDCFNDAAAEIGLPKLKFPIDEAIDAVSVTNYKGAAANIYFNINIVEIDRKTRQAFPHVKFHLRFCMSHRTQHYYLIFDDLSSKEMADAHGTTAKIIDFVLSMCKQNDPLQIFCDNIVTPSIMTREEIIQSGKAMGIMRNNPDFETL